MDSKVSENTSARPLRRSMRQASVKGLSFEPTPRGPLKRTKRGLENQAPAAAVNGNKDMEKGSDDDEESPSKKSRLDAREAAGDMGDENKMDVQESAEDMEEYEDQEMDDGQESSHETQLPKKYQGVHVSLSPRVNLGDRCRTSNVVSEDPHWMKPNTVKPSTKAPVSPTKSAGQITSAVNRHHVPSSKVTSMAEYKRTMEGKAKTTDIHRVNHLVPSVYPTRTIRQRANNIPTQKETVHLKKQEGIKKPAVTKRTSGSSCRGFLWYLGWLFLVMALSSATFLVYTSVPALQRTVGGGGGPPSRAVKAEKFADHLSLLRTQFPSQRPDVWIRSRIHLEKHLKTAQPTEPVSLILTAGRSAERTLRCLAQGLASSFSSALNASVLHIDGASKSQQDSDETKLDIDRQLQTAFEGEKPVAVIHRFEELPPGSTLIFYRYCDHENAAYKRVFLLFTVLLPRDEVRGEQSLKEVEEMVQDYVKERLVDSSDETAFNKMDSDKYGGLWSRISHLILPVVTEGQVEQKGC